MQTADLSIWCGYVTRLDPKDIFHMHAINLHLLLYVSEKQGEVPWNNWFNFAVKLTESSRRSWSKGTGIICPAIFVWSTGWRANPIFFPVLSLPGNCFFPSTCQCMKYAGLSSACTKKTWQLEACWNKHTRGEHRDCQNTSIMASVMHVCRNVSNSYDETARSFIQLSNLSSGEHLCFISMSWVF